MLDVSAESNLVFFLDNFLVYTTCMWCAINSTLFQCQTLNEEEIFEVQDKLSLFPLGWIHVSVWIILMASNCQRYFLFDIACSWSVSALNHWIVDKEILWITRSCNFFEGWWTYKKKIISSAGEHCAGLTGLQFLFNYIAHLE